MRTIAIGALLALTLAACANQNVVPDPNLTGSWNGTLTTATNETDHASINLVDTNGTIAGTAVFCSDGTYLECEYWGEVTGTRVKSSISWRISWTLDTGRIAVAGFIGRATDSELTGKITTGVTGTFVFHRQ